MNLINWPTNDSTYTDTGEGGLFAYLFVPWGPEPTRSQGGCNVDVEVSFSFPDVVVTRTDIWPKHDLKARWEDLRSDQVAAAAFLGATNMSLFNDRTGDYFEVSVDNLTPAGAALHAALKGAYGVDPVILTFLDT